ncbi:Hypothetical protein CAP_3744 [Chondromyces apiculatus DSM 436]|uniref:Uncharacterized protein n=1 Tax=Chondromyces apiculatus DSM 436 TaxID=1192034 RepID=A0A017T6P4_9BACT|nr:Hypothetical protein CAP_3744 [Chondromyces apiculatus DSM 436]
MLVGVALASVAGLGLGCGKHEGSAGAPASSATPQGSGASTPGAMGAPGAPGAPGAGGTPAGAASPFAVVLESASAITFSGVSGGVWIGHEGHARMAQAVGAGDLVEGSFPGGLPAGPGRVVRVAGRSPGALWLSFEETLAEGKGGATPLFRITRGELRKVADDWLPQIATWSKNRILSASTSSGKLKIKVLEPHQEAPPADIPGARLDDAGCARSFKLKQLGALATGEVFGAGTCTPEGAKTASYVVIRWAPPDGGGPDAGGAGPDAGSAGPDAGSAGDAGSPGDAGTLVAPGEAASTAGEGVPEPEVGLPGVVSVVPGSSGLASHRALHARSSTEVYTAAVDERRGTSHLARFDGAVWSVEPLPATAEPLRALSGTAGGTLWMVTAREVWRRSPAGGWEQVPLPVPAFTGGTAGTASAAGSAGEGRWEPLDVWGGGGEEVWVAARHTTGDTARHVVLRARQGATPQGAPGGAPPAPPVVLRWP